MDIKKNVQSLLTTNEYDKIKRAYEATIPSKIDLLAAAIQSAQQTPNQENLTALKNIIHKIGGSAGSYGYPSISTICKEMDSEIGRRISYGQIEDKNWLASFDNFLIKMREEFQVPSKVDPKVTYKTNLSTQRPFLYVIDENMKFLEFLMRIKNEFSITLETECDPNRALERLLSPDFNPNIVAVSQTFNNSQLSGFDLIAKIRSKQKSSPMKFGLFLDQDSIENRITAAKLDVDYVFNKPISAHILLKSIQDVSEAGNPPTLKALVVDDDIDFCNYVSLALSEVGITVRSLEDSSNLFKTLEEFHPSILLLDIILPKYDGLDILRTLRQDLAYRNLIIILVTISEEEKIRIDAYKENADEILYKPIDKELLQKRVINLSQRQNSIIELSNKGVYTGLGNLTALKENLRKSLENGRPSKKHLILFQVDHFDELQKENAVIARDLVISIGNQIQWEADKHMKNYSYNFIFAVIFDSQTITEIETKMNEFLLNIIRNEDQFHPDFNCSIIPISPKFGNAEEILKVAEQGLQEASTHPPAPVRFKKIIPEGEATEKKEVFIIDPDQGLLKILKNAFESHGLVVHTYTEGGEALKQLNEYTENRLPALIIAERKLPDMDGIDLYIKLKERFRIEIPFYVLTIFASDKDISEGVKKGILEYIVKPFNISLLIQKALKTIFKN